MPKVLIVDDLNSVAETIFHKRGIDVVRKMNLNSNDIVNCIGEYDGLAIRSSTKVTSAILQAARNLKVIGRAGIGVENVDINEATARGVVVMNTPSGNSITTAEHTIALIFALARKIPEASNSTHAGNWEKDKFLGTELFGKILGIIGCGSIGSIVANRALGIKMKVIAYDPYITLDRCKDLGVEKVSLDELLSKADFISLHAPLTTATKNIIDKKSISKMKNGVRIINCARGELVVENDLISGLLSGKVTGAAIDVFSEEPARYNDLFGMKNVIVTPHLGASTIEAQENVSAQIAVQISDYLLEGTVINALNMASISAEDLPRIRPYLELMKQIGSFLGQIINFEVQSVSLDFEGNVAKLNTHPLTSIALEGIFKYLMDSVNMVNVSHVARERGIEVIQTTNEHSPNYQSLVRVTVKGSQQMRMVAGTLFAGDQPRVVEVDEMKIEAQLEKHMLFVTNDDLPGFVGLLGGALGDAGINIATFQLGRKNLGGKAMSLIALDTQISESTLQAINALPLINSAISLKFT